MDLGLVRVGDWRYWNEYREFEEIARELKKYSDVFYAIWHFDTPVFDTAVPFAALELNQAEGYIRFLLNPDKWKTLTKPEKVTLILHEMMHFMLDHDIRGLKLSVEDNAGELAINKKKHSISNISADLALNQILTKNFGVMEDTINGMHGMTIKYFKEELNIDLPVMRSMEEYFTLLQEEDEKGNEELQNLINAHPDMTGYIVLDLSNLDEDKRKLIEGMLDKSNRTIDKRDLERMGILAGKSEGNTLLTFDKYFEKTKQTWEKLFYVCLRRFVKDEVEVDQWIHLNRRIVDMDNNLMIPYDYEMEDEKPKVNVRAYLDVSGSCYHLGNRFLEAVRSIPEDRFDLTCVLFDTRLIPIDYKTVTEVHAGGGTSFSQIEDEVESMNRYPGSVFVFTDGHGNVIRPTKPERWFVFNTERDSWGCFPNLPNQNRYYLSDFE